MSEPTVPQTGTPYAVQVLTEALDKAIEQQRNLLALLEQHSREKASIRANAEVLEHIATNGSQIVDLNRAIWALTEKGE